MHKPRLKYVSEYKDRHGKWRARFRRRGFDYTFLNPAGTEEFYAEYKKLLSGDIIGPGNRTRDLPGSISALITLYYGTPDYTDLSPSTQLTYRRVLEKFRSQYGHLPVRGLQPKHIRAILNKMSDRKAAANNLLKRLRTLMKVAIEHDMRLDNPAVNVRPYKVKSEGFHSWTDAEIAQFNEHHTENLQARLALGLFIFLGQRRGDTVTLGWHSVINSELMHLVQEKTQKELFIPIHPELKKLLNLVPEDQRCFLQTGHGKPYSAKGFGNRMRKWCDEAGLPDCSSHGLRKAASRRLAEAGCSAKEIMAITGHTTLKEVDRYTKAVDQAKLAKAAVDKLN